jgi:predicted acetyltransferase
MTTDSLILRRLSREDEAVFLEAYNAWDASAGFMFAQGYEPGMGFLDYVELLTANERGELLPQGFVAATTLCGFVGKNLVGRLAIRHELNDFLFKIGGHIGYGVVPGFRRMGYAKQMLAQALPIARELKLSKVLVTCDDDNIGSIKTIEACCGVLENKIDAGPGKPLKRRYWIDL